MFSLFRPHNPMGGDVWYELKGNHIALDNGIVRVTISVPGGIVTGIRYGGLDNLLEILNRETNRGYWDLNWNEPGGKDTFDVPQATMFNIITANKDKVEVSFTRLYNPSNSWKMVPLNIDKRFALLRGCSGFYTYAIYERPSEWPDFSLNQTRVTFKLLKDRFHYMAISDNKQRIMPLPDDLTAGNCKKLAYPEAALLLKPKNSTLQGEVDDKYQYSCDNRENRLHGWISFDPMVGFWIITPSDEFRNGGPLKQNLTSHVGPTSLAMFHSAHYAGDELCPKFHNGEAWQKVFGPVYIYLNSMCKGSQPFCLWEDAKLQMVREIQAWPYEWPEAPSYQKQSERGCIFGQLLVHDRFAVQEMRPACYAFLGLAAPGEKGSWQKESKGYQFWSQADENGNFCLKNIRSGTYNLYGWVPGILGDYMKEESIYIYPGCNIDIGVLIYAPPRDGPTIWEIGIPDRTAGKFFIPDPNPSYINRLFVNHRERFRQYGLWERYSEIFQNNDLIYIVGSSDWRTDWYFAHTCRIHSDGSLHPATWQVKFQLSDVQPNNHYKLRLAIASSTNAALQIRFNDQNIYRPHFDTMQFGKDNAIARHGIHGLYHLFNIDVSGKWLVEGENTMYITQRKPTSPFTGVMYDYLRLEKICVE
eukprot:TRINITY_DN8830_c0_g1_i1.p1 TRINITY_DN8830_c0_g1~~TRINITY_DN8830_c0_g1_i1.p1  ORF type:complete len:644 (+),score=75.58 TRINITY_DN8830_c0_g1_i1:259-2190(+)